MHILCLQYDYKWRINTPVSFKLLNGFFDSHDFEIPAQSSVLLKHINAYIFAFEINIDINILLALSC